MDPIHLAGSVNGKKEITSFHETYELLTNYQESAMESQFAARFSLRHFLNLLFKRKVQILAFFLATLFAVTVITFIIRPIYEAKAQILVKIGKQNLYLPPSNTSGHIISYSRDDQINSEIELLKSRSLAEKAIKALGPDTVLGPKSIISKLFAADRGVLTRSDQRQSTIKKSLNAAVEVFQDSLSVEGVKKSEVIAIKFKHRDPETAALITNKLVDIYIDEHLLVHQNPKFYSFFEEQANNLKIKLTYAENMLKQFKTKNNLTDLEEQQRLLLHHISNLRGELNHTLSQKAETENRLYEIRQQLDNTAKTIPQWEEVDHNPQLVSNLESRLVELQLKEKEYQAKYTPQSRLIENIKAEIRIVQHNLAEMEKKRYGKSRVGLNAAYQQLQEVLLRNQVDSKALAAKKEIQNNQLADYQNKLAQLNQMAVKLTHFEEAVNLTRKNYRLYLAKIEESRISDAMDSEKISNVSLMERALVPLKPVSPKKLFNLVMGFFVGAFGALGLAFVLDYLDDSLENPEETESILKLPILASVPDLKIPNTKSAPSGPLAN